MEGRLVQREGLNGGQIGRLLHDDAVALVQQHLPQKVEDLLGTGGDEHVVGGVIGAEALVVAAGDPIAQPLDAGGGGVLKGVSAALGHHTLHRFQQRLLRE